MTEDNIDEFKVVSDETYDTTLNIIGPNGQSLFWTGQLLGEVVLEIVDSVTIEGTDQSYSIIDTGGG